MAQNTSRCHIDLNRGWLLQVGLLSLMYEDQTDFINTFRALASAEPEADSDDLPSPLQKVRTSYHRNTTLNLSRLKRKA